MKKLIFPYIRLPQEFCNLLKANLSVTSSPAFLVESFRSNPALLLALDRSFEEFDSGRGLEKVITTLGWSNFRERVASIYLYKSLYGDYPLKSDMELVEDIIKLENRYADYSVHSYSRIFLLAFYLKLANIELQRWEDSDVGELKIPEVIHNLLKLSQGRSEKIDWLIVTLMHFINSLGDKLLLNALLEGKILEELYELMPEDDKLIMTENMLAYGASIQENDLFLYQKI
jgi:hypothetical protein